MSGVTKMEVQSAIAFDTDELERLKSSNLLKDFVSAQQGNWNHEEWENFLSSVRELGYNLPGVVIGAELEMEKTYYWKVKNGEIIVPENSMAPGQMEQTPCETEALVCEKADELQKISPNDVGGPRAPEMPKKAESFDPISELENAVIIEEKHVEETNKAPEIQAGLDPWKNVNFESLSREERAAYLKDQLKKKLGEG